MLYTRQSLRQCFFKNQYTTFTIVSCPETYQVSEGVPQGVKLADIVLVTMTIVVVVTAWETSN